MVGRYQKSVDYWTPNLKHLTKAIECHLFPEEKKAPRVPGAKRRKTVVPASTVVKGAVTSEKQAVEDPLSAGPTGGLPLSLAAQALAAPAAEVLAVARSGGAVQTDQPGLPLENSPQHAPDASATPAAPAAKTAAPAATGQTSVASAPASAPTVYSVVLTPLT